jgi:hypothetical protein
MDDSYVAAPPAYAYRSGGSSQPLVSRDAQADVADLVEYSLAGVCDTQDAAGQSEGQALLWVVVIAYLASVFIGYLTVYAVLKALSHMMKGAG